MCQVCNNVKQHEHVRNAVALQKLHMIVKTVCPLQIGMVQVEYICWQAAKQRCSGNICSRLRARLPLQYPGPAHPVSRTPCLSLHPVQFHRSVQACAKATMWWQNVVLIGDLWLLLTPFCSRHARRPARLWAVRCV